MKNDTDINLKLRTEILEIALNLEHSVNQLLLLLLSIENQKRKAISNKSGNLSFKNKIDLLFDLDVLIADEHLELLLLMEFRNQFLHNIECCFFEDVVNQLGVDKGKRLLKFCDIENIDNKEFQYQNAFRKLNIKCLKIISKKLQDRSNKLEDRRKSYANLIQSQLFFIDKYFDLLKSIMMVCEEHIQGNPAVIPMINKIRKVAEEDADSLKTSKEYAQIQQEFQKLHADEKLKSYFKW